MVMSRIHTCEECGVEIPYVDTSVPPRSLCSSRCSDAWEEKNPGEWIAVEDMTFMQRAELAAVLGISPNKA